MAVLVFTVDCAPTDVSVVIGAAMGVPGVENCEVGFKGDVALLCVYIPDDLDLDLSAIAAGIIAALKGLGFTAAIWPALPKPKPKPTPNPYKPASPLDAPSPYKKGF